MSHSIQVSDEFWADAQERWDVENPASRIRETTYKAFYISWQMEKDATETTTGEPVKKPAVDEALPVSVRPPVVWTPELIAKRGTDRGSIMRAKFSGMRSSVSGKHIHPNDIVVVYTPSDDVGRRRVLLEEYNQPPHLPPPRNLTGDTLEDF